MRSGRNKVSYILLRTASIIFASIIPLGIATGLPSWVIAAIGSAVAAMVGTESLGQFHENWIRYRSTCEALRGEKHFFIARAGPYSAVKSPDQTLAVRLERLLSHERSRWLAARELPEESRPT